MGPLPRVRGRLAGQAGERLAAELLERRGYEVVGRGFVARRGEIDLLCRRRGDLFIFEVKTRTSTRFGPPADAIGVRKRRALAAAAREYRLLADWRGPIRFGIVSLILNPDGSVNESEVIEDPW